MALLLAGTALLFAPAAAGALAPPGQGVANARKAGIKVSPAAARMMEQAPIGLCFNDPTQEGCPKGITEVVAQKFIEQPDGSLGYAITDEQGAPATAVASSKARASQDVAYAAAVPQCFVRAGYPYYSGGYMWGDGAHQCTLAASSQELYVSLDRTTDGVWRTLDTRYSGPQPGGITIRRTAGYNCGHTNLRHYRSLAQGYAVVQGRWYGAQQERREFRTC